MNLENEEVVRTAVRGWVVTQVTQREAAEFLGISPQMLSMVLSGHRHVPAHIAEKFGYRPVVGYERIP